MNKRIAIVNHCQAVKLGFKSLPLHFYLFLQEKNIVLIMFYTRWPENRDLLTEKIRMIYFQKKEKFK